MTTAMELRLLEIVLRLLDPRKWRRRLLQLGGLGAATGWVWVRSVQHAGIDRAIRDVRRAERANAIRDQNVGMERAKLACDDDRR